jgi:hypothetical protein
MQDKPAKKKPAYKPRICEDCGASFIPKSSRGTRCPECRKEHRKEWRDSYNHDYYQANQSALVEYAAEYRAEHPEEHRAASLRWEQANPDRKQVNDAAYRERNRERLRIEGRESSRKSYARHAARRRASQRAYYVQNTAQALEACRRWRVANPEFRSAANARRRLRRGKGLTPEDRGISRSYRQAIRNDPCFYCGAPGAETDHFFPLVLGGTDIWFNLVRACVFCNRSKKASCGTAFMLRTGWWNPPPLPPLILPAAA